MSATTTNLLSKPSQKKPTANTTAFYKNTLTPLKHPAPEEGATYDFASSLSPAPKGGISIKPRAQQRGPTARALSRVPTVVRGNAYKKPLFFSAVKINKRYVSYHLMPVYVFTDLRNNTSPQLEARMQGKSCFNFTTPDAPLFAELEKPPRQATPATKKPDIASTLPETIRTISIL